MPADQHEPLTDTELQILAILLDSATQHMADVRTADGSWAWTDDFLDAVKEIQQFFYGLQVEQNTAAGDWDKMMVPLRG